MATSRFLLTILLPLSGYKEFKTNRKYLAQMGDWRNNKDDEVELDGIGGVNIIVKADVHRSGRHLSLPLQPNLLTFWYNRHQLSLLCL